MNKVLIMHDNDQDGFCAAAIAEHHYKNLTDTEVEVRNILQPEVVTNDYNIVVYLDHTPSITAVTALLAAGKEVLILDHHPETIELFTGVEHENLTLGYNDDMSTCKLAWIHFNPEAEKAPFVVEMINKWDTWKHDEENILPFHYGLACMNLGDADLWDTLLWQKNDQAAMQLIAMGNAVGQFWLATMNDITEPTSWIIEKDSIKYAVCNAQLTSSYDVMSAMTKNECQGAVWFYNENNGTENTWVVVRKVMPSETQKTVSAKAWLTYEELKNEWFPKEGN